LKLQICKFEIKTSNKNHDQKQLFYLFTADGFLIVTELAVLFVFEFEAAFAFAAVFASTTGFRTSGCAAFAFAFVSGGAAELAFVSVAAVFAFASAVFEFAVSAGVSPVVLSTDILPVNAGMAINNADIINTAAATIVIFDKTVAVPRGANAELDTLLVNNAPASVLPGCSSTDPTSTMQERKNNV